MTSYQLDIQLLAAVTAAACALPGVFLVLRRMAMLSDAISHSILLGIVLAFFITNDLTSPLLVVGAALVGVATVTLVELLQRTGRVKEDAAIGLVFPLLFSVGVILIARYAGNVHLDTDAVLLGELAFTPFNRLGLSGYDLGPRALWMMGGILALNIALVTLLYKELKLATFDPGLAAALGFAPGLVHYLLTASVSVTAVGAFDAVGSVLVVGLMVGPAATAYLLTDRLPVMIWLSALIGAGSAIAGYWVAHIFDVSIAGSIAAVIGVAFAVVFLVAPRRGIIAVARRRTRQKWSFAQTMLAIHLRNHEGTPEALEESRVSHLGEGLRWDHAFATRVVALATRNGLVTQTGDHLALTPTGHQRALDYLNPA